MALDKKWIVKEPGNPAIVRNLASELGVDPSLANLLVQRNITNLFQAKSFFRPQLEDLHDPFLMKDMDKAVRRLDKAIKESEKILVYGDYDVDGTTAVALVYSFLRKETPMVSFYIPDRYTEGYGISYVGIDHAVNEGCTLIIALDCGIKAIEKVVYAKERGIDFIICDHHLPAGELPKAAAVLNPKRNDCNYPFNELSGCGVGFKFMQAFCQRKNIPLMELYPFLDLLVVSIAADLVSITGENRILAHYGLQQLNEAPRKGLLSIIKLAGLEKHRITMDDIVFKIGPRINAAGRMESGKMAVDLLISRTDDVASKIGDTINDHNDDRKYIDRKITQEALTMVREMEGIEQKKSIVLYNSKWHKGVVGIVASRLVETFYRPTIVLTESNGYITGSARSITGFDLYEAIEQCGDLMESFGGHMYAAGLTMKEEHLEEFTSRFEKWSAEKISDDMLTPQVSIDTYLEFRQITPKFFRLLKQFQPFGPGNESPVFVTEDVYDNGNGRLVGSDAGHLKLELIQEDEPYRAISAIAFNQSEHFDHLHNGNPVDICYSVAENYYRGIANLQLRVKDIKIRDLIV